MGISDLLKLLTGGGGDDAAPAIGQASDPTAGAASAALPATPPTDAGVAPFLQNTDPGAQDQASPPPPYATTPPAAPAAAPGPSTPPADTGAGGLSGFLSRMVQKATARDPNTGQSFVDKVGQLGGSITDAAGATQGAEQQAQNEAALRVAQTKRAQLMQMGKQLGMNPREQLIFTADPEAWVKANATGLETQNIPGGDTRFNGATGSSVTAPKLGVENGEGYAAGANGLTDTGGLAQSPQQKAMEDVKRAQEAAMNTYHQLMAQAAIERAHADTTRANKPPALGNGGGWLPQGAKVVGVGRPQ